MLIWLFLVFGLLGSSPPPPPLKENSAEGTRRGRVALAAVSSHVAPTRPRAAASGAAVDSAPRLGTVTRHPEGGGTGHLGRTETQRGRLWTACGQRCVDSCQTTVKRPRQQPAHPPIRQLLGAADAQTAHPATSSTAPAHQPLGSVNAETTPAGAPAAAADRTQRPDATCEGKNG